jgi:hypothetical protein
MRKRALGLLSAAVFVATGLGAVVSRLPAQAQTPDYFEIFFINTDNGVRMGSFTFEEPLWDFGDRPGYKCAWAFLMDDGVAVARVQFDRGQTYTAVNDKYGEEHTEDGSQCILHEELETKPKPAGLADSVVTLNSASGTLATLRFPATSPQDAESWWELEEWGADHVEAELYWREDVAVVATITSLSPSATFAARSTAPPVVNAFSPQSGGPGTQVKITGANFVEVTSVTFGGTAATFEAESAGEIIATVPAGADSGPIAVTTTEGTTSSTGSFAISSGVVHDTKVSLKLSGKLVAAGSVKTLDNTTPCIGGRTVVVQRRKSGAWKQIATDVTADDGSYRKKLKNKKGAYRSVVKKSYLANGDACLRDASPKRVRR